MVRLYFKSVQARCVLMCAAIAAATASTAVIAGQIPYGSGVELSGEYLGAAGWANDDYIAAIFLDGTFKYFTAEGGSTNVNVEFEQMGLERVAANAFDVRDTIFATVFSSYEGKDNISVAVVDIESIENPKLQKYGLLFEDWQGDFPIRVSLDPTGSRFAVLLSRSGQVVLYEYDFDNTEDVVRSAAKTTQGFLFVSARPVFRDDGKIYLASYRSIFLLKKEEQDLVIETETVYNDLNAISFMTCIAVQKSSPYNAVIVMEDSTYSLPYFVSTGGATGTILQGPRSRGVVTGVLGPVGRSVAKERVDVCEISDDGRYLAFGSSSVEGFGTSANPLSSSFVSPFANNDPDNDKDANFISVLFRPLGDVFLVASVTVKDGQPPVSYIASYRLEAQASPSGVVTPSPTRTVSPSPTRSTTASPSPTRSTSASPSPTRSTSASPSPTRSTSASPSPTRSTSASPSPTRSTSASPSPTRSTSASPIVSFTPGVTPSPTRSPTVSPIVSFTPGVTPSPTRSATVSPIVSFTPGVTPSPTRSATVSPIVSFTPGVTPSPTRSATVSPIVSFTPGVTPSPIRSPTVSPIVSFTPGVSPSPTITFSVSPTPTVTGNITNSPSASVTVTASPGGDSVCFPASAWVRTCSGTTKLMSSVEVGDCVQVRPDGTQSTVFMWGHHSLSRVTEFVNVEYRFKDSESGTLSLSPDHYLYVFDALVRAADVQIGDEVRVFGNHVGIVSGVSRTKQVGLYHPHTLHGDIMVNGVHVSTFAAILPVWFQYTVLGVFRWIYLAVGTSGLYNEYLSGILDEGSVIRPVLLKMLKWGS